MSRRAITLTLWLLTGAGYAQNAGIDQSSAVEKGRAIALEADRREAGFGDTATELTMALVNAEGRVRTRRLTWRILEGTHPNEGDKSLTIFHEPRDIEGTAFLSYTYINRPDDQWLYLPSLKRVKRIASANQASAFVGSDLSYEDLLSDEVEKFEYRWLTDEPCGSLTCFVVERRPLYEGSGYSKQIVWIDQVEYRPIQIEYYDRRERLLKTLTLDDYRQYLGRFWRAHVLRMQNNQTGKATLLTFRPFAFGTGLTADAFDPGALTRVR